MSHRKDNGIGKRNSLHPTRHSKKSKQRFLPAVPVAAGVLTCSLPALEFRNQYSTNSSTILAPRLHTTEHLSPSHKEDKKEEEEKGKKKMTKERNNNNKRKTKTAKKCQPE